MDAFPINILAQFGSVSDILSKEPVAQWMAIVTGTFISEDLTCLGCAWLSADGQLAMNIAWSGCFAGIWLGDAGLYLLARLAGRPFTEKWLPASWSQGESIKSAEDWIRKHGSKCLWITRFIPGTRLPTYLAAGYLRMNAWLFLFITGLAALLWTTILFWLTHRIGKELIPWLERFRWGAWIGLLGLVVLWLMVRQGWKWINTKSRHEG